MTTKDLVAWFKTQKGNAAVLCVSDDTTDQELQEVRAMLKKMKDIISVQREADVKDCWWFKDR